MSSFINGPTIFSTSKANWSSQADVWYCCGNTGGDIIATTSVGLGYVTSGTIITIVQSSGGTIAAGLTSGTEYMVVNVETGTSSFQVYAYGGSSAVELTADSTGGYDYAYVVKGGNVIPCKEYKYVTASLTPTSGYDGEFWFVGSMTQVFSPAGRLTTGNDFLRLAYTNVASSSAPVIGTTAFDSSGGTSSGFAIFKVNTEGLEEMSIRTSNFVGGGFTMKTNLYKE